MGLFSAPSGGPVGFDPAGFQISVVMNTADGVRVPLWMREGADSGEAALTLAAASAAGAANSLGGFGSGVGPTFTGADLLTFDLPIVESVSIELSLGLIGKITVDVAATYDMGLRLLDSPFFLIGNTIEVQLGYPRSQRFTPWMTAICAKPSIRISSDEGLTATINGEGGAFPELRGVSARTFTGESFKEIIQKIAGEKGWDTEFPGDSTTHIVQGAAAQGSGGNILVEEDPFTKKRDVTSQNMMSDWHFIQHICHSSGCNAYMAPSEDRGRFKLVVKRRADVFSAEPRFKFISRGRSDFATVFPALEFESEAEFVWLAGGAIKTSIGDIDPDTKLPFKFDATAQTSSEPTLGGGGVPTSAEKKIESVNVAVASTEGADRTGEWYALSSRDPRGPTEVVQAHRDALAVQGGIQAKVTSFGIPELLPGDVIQLDGIGIFNGNYGINGLTHTANDSEWSMVMDVINNATASGIMAKFFTEEPAKANESVVDEESGATGEDADVDPVDGAL